MRSIESRFDVLRGADDESAAREEIERKFWRRGLPSDTNAGIEIKQGCLSVGDPEVRVRQKGDRFCLTEKSGVGLVRREYEYEISREIFDVLWSLTAGARIEKTRRKLAAADGLIRELGEFRSPRTKGLFIAERMRELIQTA